MTQRQRPTYTHNTEREREREGKKRGGGRGGGRDLVDGDARMTALKYAHNQFKSELVVKVDHEYLRRVWS